MKMTREQLFAVGAQSGDSSVAPGSQAEDNRSESYIDEKLTISIFEIEKAGLLPRCFPGPNSGKAFFFLSL
jgi:hypothetical protein